MKICVCSSFTLQFSQLKCRAMLRPASTLLRSWPFYSIIHLNLREIVQRDGQSLKLYRQPIPAKPDVRRASTMFLLEVVEGKWVMTWLMHLNLYMTSSIVSRISSIICIGGMRMRLLNYIINSRAGRISRKLLISWWWIQYNLGVEVFAPFLKLISITYIWKSCCKTRENSYFKIQCLSLCK